MIHYQHETCLPHPMCMPRQRIYGVDALIIEGKDGRTWVPTFLQPVARSASQCFEISSSVPMGFPSPCSFAYTPIGKHVGHTTTMGSDGLTTSVPIRTSLFQLVLDRVTFHWDLTPLAILRSSHNRLSRDDVEKVDTLLFIDGLLCNSDAGPRVSRCWRLLASW